MYIYRKKIVSVYGRVFRVKESKPFLLSYKNDICTLKITHITFGEVTYESTGDLPEDSRRRSSVT